MDEPESKVGSETPGGEAAGRAPLVRSGSPGFWSSPPQRRASEPATADQSNGAGDPIREPELEAIFVEELEEEVGDVPSEAPPMDWIEIVDELRRAVATVTLRGSSMEVLPVCDGPVAEISVMEHPESTAVVVHPRPDLPEVSVLAELSIPADPEVAVAPHDCEVEGPPALPTADIDLTVEAGLPPVAEHSADCLCLSCRWGHVELPETRDHERHDMFYGVVRQLLQELSHPEAQPDPDAHDSAVGQPAEASRGLRRFLSPRDRR